MSKRVSLKDIAREIGISTALVSYVLNGRAKEKRVADEMAERIRNVARELNYAPNQVALSLKMGSTRTIGLILADIANPFFGQFARVVEDEASKAGYTVMIGSSDESPVRSAAIIETLVNRQVDGFIIVPSEGSMEQVRDLIAKGIPVVLADRYFPEINACHVVLSNYEAAYEAVNHLISNGYKRIGIVAYQSGLVHMRERVRGYADAMKHNNPGHTIRISAIRFEQMHADVEKAVQKAVWQDKADALFFATNSLSISGLYCINKYGIKVPAELAFLGFDGSEAFDFFYSPVTYVEQPIQEMAKESVNLLLRQLQGNSSTLHTQMKHTLIVRDSTKSK